jgi:hypothetical protein
MNSDYIKEVEGFAKENIKSWDDIKKTSPYKVLVDGIIVSNISWIMQLTISRAVSDVFGFKPYVLRNNINEELDVISNSFGIDENIYIKRHAKRKPWLFFKTIKFLFLFYCRVRKKKDLIEFEVNKTLIGDLIYDTHIRSKNRYRKFNIYSFVFFKQVARSIFLYFYFSDLFKSGKFKYFITSSRVYALLGVASRVALKNECNVILSIGTSIRVYSHYDEIFENQHKPSFFNLQKIIKENKGTHTDEYLTSRFNDVATTYKGAGNHSDIKNAYVDKIKYTKSQFKRKLNIDNDFPIVFINPHIFSDVNHYNGWSMFDDYYEWFVETIKFASNVKNVNWIVKPHPSSHQYSESGEVEKLVDKYCGDLVKISPSDLSTESEFYIAETILTVAGTIGIEALCMGVKPIISGDSAYSNFNLAYEPKTKKQYFDLLSNIENLNFSCSLEEIKISKSILYYMHNEVFLGSDIFPYHGMTPGTKTEIFDQKYKFIKELRESIEEISIKSDRFYIDVKKKLLAADVNK